MGQEKGIYQNKQLKARGMSFLNGMMIKIYNNKAILIDHRIKINKSVGN